MRGVAGSKKKKLYIGPTGNQNNVVLNTLETLGRPVYLLLLYTLLALAFGLFLVGKTTRETTSTIRKKLTKSRKHARKTVLGWSKQLKKSVNFSRTPTKSTARPTHKALVKKSWLLYPKLTLHKFHLPKFRIAIPKIKFKKAAVFLVGALLVAALAFWFVILKDLPSPHELTTRQVAASTKIYDRNGVLLYKIYKDVNRSVVPLSDIPQEMIYATLAAEDAEFYHHPGFSIRGIMRSFWRNIERGELTGGSTITQQLVKNALLSPEKTVVRKLKEVVLAVQVEFMFSKDQILEMYLNEVSYGGTAYGVQEAAQLYFGKDAKDLTLSEASLLAGLPKSPTRYSPFGANPDLAFARQHDVLDLMVVNNFLSKNQEDAVLNQPLTFAPNETQIAAPHFVMYVRQELEDSLGKELVDEGGLEVKTTLDTNIQDLAQQAVSQEVTKLAPLNVGNGAAVVLDTQSGEILAMVGSADYFDTAIDGNVNITTSLRQPGSSIKLVNYAYALSHGLTPATIIPDKPISFRIPGQPVYTPQNYDGAYRGNITLRSAFAESRNIPAVRVLSTYGVDKMLALGQEMGITTWSDPTRYGLSLTLGGGEVKLLDLARVYATVANSGVRPPVVSLKQIADQTGEQLSLPTCQSAQALPSATVPVALAAEAPDTCDPRQVIDPRVAYLLTNILSDNSARAPSFGSNSLLVIPGHPEVAVKTGTSNDLKDNLAIGYTKDYVVAVWVGNTDNTPMSRIASGVTGATPIFNKIMAGLLAGKDSQDWPVPKGVVKETICPLTGELACETCGSKPEWFLVESLPTKHCTSQEIQSILDQKALETSGSQILDTGAATER